MSKENGNSKRVDEYCRGCNYCTGEGTEKRCDYFLRRFERRPCPAGDGCKCHTNLKKKEETKKKKAPGPKKGGNVPNRKIEPKRARELYLQGKNGEEIAKVFGATKYAVKAWRAREGLVQKRGPYKKRR